MARQKQQDMTGVEVSARTVRANGKSTLMIYVSAYHYHDIQEIGIGRANVLAHKRGFASTGETTMLPIEKSPLSGLYQTRIEYLERWRGRSSLDRKAHAGRNS